MSQAESPNTPKLNKPGCLSAGAFLVATLFGILTMVMVMTLIGAYLWNQNRTEKLPEVQAPEPVGEYPAEGENNSETPAEVDTSVPDGTYVGTTTLPEFWAGLAGGHWDGTIVENEITIIVAEDGSVSGALMVGSIGEKSTPIDGCISQINLYVEGELSGKLTETGGTIDIQLTRTDEVWRSGCPSPTETTTERGNVQAQVSIIGNKIIKGAVPDYFSFEATKR